MRPTLTPGPGSSSYRVTTGPTVRSAILPPTWNVSSVCDQPLAHRLDLFGPGIQIFGARGGQELRWRNQHAFGERSGRGTRGQLRLGASRLLRPFRDGIPRTGAGRRSHRARGGYGVLLERGDRLHRPRGGTLARVRPPAVPPPRRPGGWPADASRSSECRARRRRTIRPECRPPCRRLAPRHWPANPGMSPTSCCEAVHRSVVGRERQDPRARRRRSRTAPAAPGRRPALPPAAWRADPADRTPPTPSRPRGPAAAPPRRRGSASRSRPAAHRRPPVRCQREQRESEEQPDDERADADQLRPRLRVHVIWRSA